MLELNQIRFLNLRSETVFCFLKLITENWSLDVMWDFDFLYWDHEYDNMDLSFGGIKGGLNHRGMVWWATSCYPVHRAESRGGCWGCSRTRCRDIVTVFGVSTWNNGDVSGECSYLVSSGGSHCFTVLLHLAFSTSSGRRNIHILFLCSTSRVPPLNLLISRHCPLGPGYRRQRQYRVNWEGCDIEDRDS